MLQFSPSDTVKWVEKYGNYSAGDATLSGTFASPTTTYTGTLGTKTGTAVGASSRFSPGDFVLIYQSRNGGDGAGKWQLNRVKTVSGDDLTFKYENQYNYGTTAQIVKLIKYRKVTINGTLTAPPLSTSTGGIIALMGKELTIVGLATATATGYQGGNAVGSSQAWSGEGSAGDMLNQQQKNGNGGGGGQGGGDPGQHSAGGGGGGNGTSGTDGGDRDHFQGGEGGAATADDTFGGGGGGGSRGSGVSGSPGSGNRGGGFNLFIFEKITVVSPTGSVRNDGGQGGAGTEEGSGGGGGAGGTNVFKGLTIILGDGLVTALGGLAGPRGGGGNGADGGVGGVGKNRVEYGKFLSGTTSPAATTIKSNIFFPRRTPPLLASFANE